MARDLFKKWQAPTNNKHPSASSSFAELKGPRLYQPATARGGVLMMTNQDRTQDEDKEDDDDDDDDDDEEESDVEAETDSDAEQIIDDQHIQVRRSPFMRLDKFRGTVMEHRELMMERQLTIPQEHPRSSFNEDLPLGLQGGEGLESGDGERSQRSNSIELRRTDAAKFAVRAEPSSGAPSSSGRHRRRMTLDSKVLAAATSSLLR